MLLDWGSGSDISLESGHEAEESSLLASDAPQTLPEDVEGTEAFEEDCNI